MPRFQTAEELDEHLKTAHYPQAVKADMEEVITHVEECLSVNQYGWNITAYLIIAETAQESEEVKAEFLTHDDAPEIEEEFQCDGQAWTKRIFIFSDAGDSIALYERANVGEK